MTSPKTSAAPTAVVTGASQGLGYELSRALAERGWHLVVDARTPDAIHSAAERFGPGATAIAGDVTDPAHRTAIRDAVRSAGRLDLLVNNASTIGVSPMPRLAEADPSTLRQIYETNVIAPLALTRALLPYLLDARGTVVNISSDAAVETYEGWGGYGPSKSALDHATAILAEEQPTIAAYAFDPGDMRTALHQAAFPDEDISDRPLPESVVPALLRLVETRPTGRRLGVTDLAEPQGAA